MTIVACPTAVVDASRDAVWRLLTDPEHYERWAEAELVSVQPRGHARPGQRIDFRVRALGRSWPVRFDVTGVREFETFAFDVLMPFGIVNHEVVVLSRLDASQTRVTFN